MCCGQNRSKLKSDGVPDPNAVKLLFRGRAPIQVRGAFTGKLYQFPRPNAVLAVDPRDATLMVQTRLFRQIQ